MKIIDPPGAHISEFQFAMEWNKIVYAQKYILNYNTIIDWTVKYFLKFVVTKKYCYV